MDEIRPLRTLLFALLALACAQAYADEEPSKKLIAQLADGQKAPGAASKLIQIGSSAIPALTDVVMKADSLVARGWAIVAVARIGGTGAKNQLESWRNNRGLPELLRTWALAAQIEAADKFSELQALYSSIQSIQALRKPWNERVRAVLQSRGDLEASKLEEVLLVANTNYQLRQALAETILKQTVRSLSEIMLTSNNNNSRRMAASYLGTKANKEGVEQIAAEFVEIYRYRGSSESVPWQGGALFVPGIKWPPREARMLMSHLIRWLRYTQERGLRQQSQQLINNLRSVGLHRAAGVRVRGNRNDAQTYFNILDQL